MPQELRKKIQLDEHNYIRNILLVIYITLSALVILWGEKSNPGGHQGGLVTIFIWLVGGGVLGSIIPPILARLPGTGIKIILIMLICNPIVIFIFLTLWWGIQDTREDNYRRIQKSYYQSNNTKEFITSIPKNLKKENTDPNYGTNDLNDLMVKLEAEDASGSLVNTGK